MIGTQLDGQTLVGRDVMVKVVVALTMSLDGFISGPNDAVETPLGESGMALFDWYTDGDTPIRAYEEAARRGA
ncbi:MAG: hypothetical protein M3R21_02535 [Candidatus Dormibacteraeota bacterium]|nr:hypothetical protein [Candidatus Dormibacteraeota bacterium]